MKITIDVPENHAKVLMRWASLGRTIDAAIRAIQDRETEMESIAVDELDILKQHLDPVFMDLRSAMWEASRRPEVRKQFCRFCKQDAGICTDESGVERFLFHFHRDGTTTCSNVWSKV